MTEPAPEEPDYTGQPEETHQTTPCPTGCGKTVAPMKLMCSGCWSVVPRPLQQDVYRTFRAWWSDKVDGDKLNAYLDARDTALVSIG